MPSSTLSLEVRAAFVAKVRALVEDTTLKSDEGVLPEVGVGYPIGSWAERIWTQRARFTQEPASLRAAATHRNEEGSFDIGVEVEGPGWSQERTTARAVAIADVLADLVSTHAEWRDLVAGLTAVKVQGDGELIEAFNDQGTIARLTLPVRYTARLTTE